MALSDNLRSQQGSGLFDDLGSESSGLFDDLGETQGYGIPQEPSAADERALRGIGRQERRAGLEPGALSRQRTDFTPSHNNDPVGWGDDQGNAIPMQSRDRNPQSSIGQWLNENVPTAGEGETWENRRSRWSDPDFSDHDDPYSKRTWARQLTGLTPEAGFSKDDPLPEGLAKTAAYGVIGGAVGAAGSGLEGIGSFGERFQPGRYLPGGALGTDTAVNQGLRSAGQWLQGQAEKATNQIPDEYRGTWFADEFLPGLGSMFSFIGVGGGAGALARAATTRAFGPSASTIQRLAPELIRKPQRIAQFSAAMSLAGGAGYNEQEQYVRQFVEDNPQLGITLDDPRFDIPLLIGTAGGFVQVANIGVYLDRIAPDALKKHALAAITRRLATAGLSEAAVEGVGGGLMQYLARMLYDEDMGLLDRDKDGNLVLQQEVLGRAGTGGAVGTAAALLMLPLQTRAWRPGNTNKPVTKEDVINHLKNGGDASDILKRINDNLDPAALEEAHREGNWDWSELTTDDLVGLEQAIPAGEAVFSNGSPSGPSVTVDGAPVEGINHYGIPTEARRDPNAEIDLTRPPADRPAPAAEGQPGAVDTRLDDAINQRVGQMLGQPDTTTPDAPAQQITPEAEPAPEPATSPATEASGQTERLTTPDRPDVQIPRMMIPATELQTDAEAYQYKAGGDAEGVTGRLQGVKQWDDLKAGRVVVHERLDGTRYVADGHQRLGLARKLAAEGQPVPSLDAIVLREADGFTVEDARRMAATKNIAEGTGTAWDAAKIFRESGEASLGSLPPNSVLVRDGQRLARLSEEASQAAINADIDPAYAGIAAMRFSDPAEQLGAIQTLARLKPTTQGQAHALMEDLAAVGMRADQSDMFGGMDDSVLQERMKIIDRVRARVTKDRGIMAGLINNQSTIEGAAQNVIDEAGTDKARQDAETIARLIQHISTNVELNQYVTEQARQVADGETTRGEAIRAVLKRSRSFVGTTAADTDARGPEAVRATDERSQAPQEQQVDPLSPPTEAEQAAADRAAEVDRRLDATDSPDMLEGDGELFAGRRPDQSGLFGEAVAESPAYDWRADTGRVDESVRGDLVDRYEKAERALPIFRDTMTDIASSVGGRAIVPPLKNIEGASDKAVIDYDGDASKVVDILRGTIEVPAVDMAAVDSVISQLTERYGQPLKLKHNLDPSRPPLFPNGYRDVNSVWIVDGQPVEIQINVPEMLEAKRRAHPFYKEHQALERRVDSEGREFTRDEFNRLDELDARQAEIYEPAWRSAIARLNSSSEISSASSLYRDVDRRTGVPEDQSNVLPPPADDQGLPSTRPKVSEGGRLADVSGIGESVPQANEWAYYPAGSGSLGIPRSRMPQIKRADREAFFEFLSERGISNEQTSLPPDSLQPTQAEYSHVKVARFIETGPIGGRRDVLVSSDGFVLDGHHQWMAHQQMGTDVPVIRLGASIRDLLEAAYDFPRTQHSEGMAEPGQPRGPVAPSAETQSTPETPPDGGVSRSGRIDSAERTAQDGAHDRDTGTLPIGERQSRFGRLQEVDADRSRSGPVQGDLFLAPRTGPAAGRREVARRVRAVRVGAMRSGIAKVTGPAEAAHVVASLRKQAQEVFGFLVLDADQRPLAFKRQHIGGVAEANISMQAIGDLYEIPGAAFVYMVHNHPSGRADQSPADRRMSQGMDKLLHGTGLEYLGSVVVTPGGKYTFDKWYADPSAPETIPARRRTQDVPVTERQLRGRASDGADYITSPASARGYVRQHHADDQGILLLSNQHEPLAFVDFTTDEAQKLRTGQTDTGFGKLASAISSNNAAAAFVVGHQMQSSGNLFAALEALQVRSLDSLTVNRDGTVDSEAEKGHWPPRHQPDTFYPRSTPEKPLFLAHNLTVGNILAAHDLGGLAAPSLAVARAEHGFESFGEVTLLADPSLLQSDGIRAFGSDVYTPRQPRAHYSIDTAQFDTFIRSLDPDGLGLSQPGIDQVSGEDGASALLGSVAVQLRFLEAKGRVPRLYNIKGDPFVRRASRLDTISESNPDLIRLAERYFRDQVKRAKEADPGRGEQYESLFFNEDGSVKNSEVRDFERRARDFKSTGGKDVLRFQEDIYARFRSKRLREEYERWVTDTFNGMVKGKRLFKGFTDAGNRRYVPYTMENVLRDMTRKLRGGESFFYGAGFVRSAYVKELKTLRDIQARRDDIISEADFKTIRDESNRVLADALDKLKPFYKFDAGSWGYSDDAGSAIAEGRKGIREAFNVTPEAQKIIDDLVGYLRNLPTTYFEAKAGRAVQFSEFDTAVVPRGMNRSALQVLRDAGLKIKTYNPNTEGDRARVVAEQEKLLFSRSEGGPGTTAEAVKKSLTARAQRALLDSGLVTITEVPAQWPGNHPANAAGAWIDGKIYLATNNIRPGRERGLILHEIGVHHGLKDTLGERYDALMGQLKRQVERGGRPGAARAQREAHAAHQRALADDTIQGNQDAIWEETIAYMAEAGADSSLFRQIVAAVRDFLRNLGLVRGFTSADVAHLARGSVARVVDGIEANRGTSYAPESLAYARTGDDATARPVQFTGNELGGLDQDIATLKQKAREFARERFAGKTVTNQSDGSEIFIPWSGIKHSLSGEMTPAGVIATSKLDELIGGGQKTRTEPDSRGRRTIKAVHTYEAVARIDGTDTLIRVIVRETNQGRLFYDHYEIAGESPSGSKSSGEGPSTQSVRPIPDGESTTDAADTQTVPSPAEPSQSGDSTSPDIRHSRSEQTRSDYEQRIDELFAGGDAARLGVRVLDSSDVLEVLGYGQRPVHVAEGKIKAGRQNHHLKAEHWKKIPEWLDNPVAVFESDTVPGRLVAVAPDTVNGAPVMMILEPDADFGSTNVHLLVNAYDKDQGGIPFRRWAEDGLWLYGDEKRIPAFNRASGLRLPRVSDFRQGYGKKIHTQNDLVKHRKQAEGGKTSYSRREDSGFIADPSDPNKPARPGKEIFSTTVFIGRDSNGKAVTVQSGHPSLREQGKLRKHARKLFTKEGLFNPETFARHIETQGLKNADEVDVQFMTAELIRQVTRAYRRYKLIPSTVGYELIPAAEKEKMNNYLAGESVEGLPRKVRDALDVMRGALDNLSNRLIMMIGDEVRFLASGMEPGHRQTLLDHFNDVVSGDEAAIEAVLELPHGEQVVRRALLIGTIEGNKGHYLNRSYRVFDDASWRPDAAVIEDARGFLLKQIESSPEFSDLGAKERADHVEGIINSIIGNSEESLTGLLSSSLLGRKDLSILKRRKEIAPEIRALMGEHTDPRLNFARSMTKMSYLVANHHFLSKVREDGLGHWLSTRPSGEMSVQIAEPGDPAMMPLAGLYAPPDFAQALRDYVTSKPVESHWRMYYAMNGAVKYGKTVLSPTTSFRNFWSASMFMVMNGHFDVRQTLGAAQHTWADMVSKNASSREYIRKMVELGVLHDNPRAGELVAAMQDAMDMDPNAGGLIRRAAKAPLSLATRIYRAGDDFWKIVGFENEKSSLMKYGMKEAEAEKMAADRIRNGYPTYSMVPEAIRWLRKFPTSGTFVSFPWEITRTTIHQIRFVQEDFKAGRNAMAARRLVGMAVAGANTYAIGALLMSLYGISDEDDEAIRALAAPWQRNAQFAYLPPDEEGRIRYMDMTHMDPYSYLKLPIEAIRNGNNETVTEKVGEALKEMLEPFIGTEIAFGAIMDVASNKRRDTGGPIYDESAPRLEKGKRAFDHLRKSLQPGLFANMERTLKAARGEVTSYGRKYSLKDEALGWVGFRLTTSEPDVSLQFRSFDFLDSYRESISPVYRQMRDPNPVSDKAIRQAVRQADGRWKASFDELHKSIRAAKVTGMTDQDIARTLTEARVPRKHIPHLVRLRTPPWEPSKGALDSTYKASVGGRNTRITHKEFRQRMDILRDELQKVRAEYGRDG